MKLITIICTVLVGFNLSACAQKQEKEKMKKTLVAFFSASGVTKGVAEQLADVAGADLYEIKPETPYTDADLDWTDKQSRSTVEMKDI